MFYVFWFYITVPVTICLKYNFLTIHYTVLPQNIIFTTSCEHTKNYLFECSVVNTSRLKQISRKIFIIVYRIKYKRVRVQWGAFLTHRELHNNDKFSTFNTENIKDATFLMNFAELYIKSLLKSPSPQLRQHPLVLAGESLVSSQWRRESAWA